MREMAGVIAVCLFAAGGCKSKRSNPADTSEARPAAVEITAAPAAPAPVSTQPECIVISQVAIKVVDPKDSPEREVYPRELARQLGRQLAQTPFFVARADEVPDGHHGRAATIDVRVTYDLVDSEERGGRVALAAIESKIDWDEPGANDLAPAVNVFAERRIAKAEHSNEDGIVAVLVSETLTQVGHDLIAKEQARQGGLEGIEQALGADDADLVVFALELIAERRHGEFMEQVIGKLGSAQDMVRNRALTALVALGDPRAVDALAKHAEFDDYEFMHMVIEAISALGGKDATDYLEFVASGHPDRDIRSRAQEGLERLNRHAEP